ncbi:hypothetical protein DK37_05460, partial [Halomonas sp. SUBG004]
MSHVPIFSRKDLLSTARATKIATKKIRRWPSPYLSRLDREMVLTSRHFRYPNDRCSNCIGGGGTPTFLTLAQMSDLVDRLDARFGLS